MFNIQIHSMYSKQSHLKDARVCKQVVLLL